MGFQREIFSSTLLLLLVGFATSDINKDKAECADQLIGMATCLPYVGGQSKAPTMDCCTSFKGVMDKSRRCVCILIKDHDDPSLGFNINLNLALNLPHACHTPSNISECVDLLHLTPNSPEAKLFQVDKSTDKNSTTPLPRAGNGTGGGSAKETSTQEKSSAGWGGKSTNWLVADVLTLILPFVFMFHFFFIIL